MKIAATEDMFTTRFVSGPRTFSDVFEPRSRAHRDVIARDLEAVDRNVVSLLSEARDRQVKAGLSPCA